jgi:hypothetical protein
MYILLNILQSPGAEAADMVGVVEEEAAEY